MIAISFTLNVALNSLKICSIPLKIQTHQNLHLQSLMALEKPQIQQKLAPKEDLLVDLPNSTKVRPPG